MANLPHRYALGESGTFEDLPTIEARPLFDRMMWAYRHMVDHYSKDQEFDMDESIYYCCEMLAVNYRITPEIAGLLQLLDDSSVPTIMAATTDASSILALQEAAKKELIFDPQWFEFLRWIKGLSPDYEPTVRDMICLQMI